MTDVDERLYFRKPEVLQGGADRIDHMELEESIHATAEGATEITVLGGYYNVKKLVELCKQVPPSSREACRVRLAVGLESSALIPRTWDDMREVRRRLRTLGFREPQVAVVMNAPAHFHTKLFRIVTGRPRTVVWYIGSANPGSDRHELMVRLTGRHNGLRRYVDAVFKAARPIGGREVPQAEITTIRDFFLNGSLCHKPAPQRIFAFEAFRFNKEKRDDLAAVLVGHAGVPHARMRTEGVSFDLASAIGLGSGEEVEAVDIPEEVGVSAGAGPGSVQIRNSSLETALGHWVPAAYMAEIEARLARREEGRALRLEQIGEALASEAGRDRARDALASHVERMAEVLFEHRIDVPSITNREEKFERFLERRAATLARVEARERLSKVLIVTPMPDIWMDDVATPTFVASALSDLAYRLPAETAPGGSRRASRVGRIVRSLQEAFDLEVGMTDDEIREIMEDTLKRSGWTEESWIR